MTFKCDVTPYKIYTYNKTSLSWHLSQYNVTPGHTLKVARNRFAKVKNIRQILARMNNDDVTEINVPFRTFLGNPETVGVFHTRLRLRF